MIPASKSVESFAQSVAAELSRKPDEPGVARLAASIESVIDVDAALADMVAEGNSIVPNESIFVRRDMHRHFGACDKGIVSQWLMSAYPSGLSTVEGAGATPHEAVAAFRKSFNLAKMRKTIEDRARKELDALTAIDAGTRHEVAEPFCEFTGPMEGESRGEVNENKMRMDPALREMVAMDHDDTIERFSKDDE